MRLVIVAFVASVAFGQTSRVFQLTQNESKREPDQIATVLRAMDTKHTQHVSVDDTKGAVTVEGTAEQIAMADWLVGQLDLPANGQFSGVHEYLPPAGGGDVLRVFYATHSSTPQELQEIATIFRTIADVRWLVVYSPLSAVVGRGTVRQMSVLRS